MSRLEDKRRLAIVCIGGLALLGLLAFGFVRYVESSRLWDRLPEEPDISGQSELFREELETQTGKISLFGNIDSGLRGLAMLYHGNRYFQEALLVYGLLQERDPNNPRWVYLVSDIHQSNSNFQAIETALERVYKMGAAYGPNLLKLGRLAMRRGEMERAEMLFKSALEIDQNTVSAYDALIYLYTKTGDKKQIKKFEEGRKRLGNLGEVEVDPWLDEIYDYCFDPDQLLVRADILIQNGKFDKAASFLERAIAIDTDDWKPFAMLMHLEKRRGNVLKAIEACKAAMDKGADVETALSEIVSMLKEIGQGIRGEEFIVSAMQTHGEAAVFYEFLSDLQVARGAVDSALLSLRRAAVLNPSSARIQTQLGELLWRLGDQDSAVACFERAVVSRSYDSKAMLYLAQYYSENERFREAEYYVKKALLLEPGNAELQLLSADFFERYGSSELAKGNFENAIRLFRLAVKWSTEPVPVKQLLADAMFKGGRVDEGIAILNLLVEEGLAQPEVYMTLGEFSLIRKDYKKARAFFTEAIVRGKTKTGYARLVTVANERLMSIDMAEEK